ncbi:hypothetical protein GOP47_0015911 [Adiantum capillus-veneris]|uniref:Transmembrane protein n=1 Tax=Adiantum capillus-veneris TaxID=13818 RepID=A0A9D4ZDN2_ADICA|nr:hypothetical protein GOP47_0015911 [Adiantum capillus-veneris]
MGVQRGIGVSSGRVDRPYLGSGVGCGSFPFSGFETGRRPALLCEEISYSPGRLVLFGVAVNMVLLWMLHVNNMVDSGKACHVGGINV